NAGRPTHDRRATRPHAHRSDQAQSGALAQTALTTGFCTYFTRMYVPNSSIRQAGTVPGRLGSRTRPIRLFVSPFVDTLATHPRSRIIGPAGLLAQLVRAHGSHP